MKLLFSRRILENTRISGFMKIRHVEPSSMRTDMTKLNVASRNFANAPINWTPLQVHMFCAISRTVSPCFTFDAASWSTTFRRLSRILGSWLQLIMGSMYTFGCCGILLEWRNWQTINVIIIIDNSNATNITNENISVQSQLRRAYRRTTVYLWYEWN